MNSHAEAKKIPDYTREAMVALADFQTKSANFTIRGEQVSETHFDRVANESFVQELDE